MNPLDVVLEGWKSMKAIWDGGIGKRGQFGYCFTNRRCVKFLFVFI